MKTMFGALIAGLALATAPVAVSHASTLTMTYYTISSSDPDANELAGGVFNNEVQQSLGPDGLPVLNVAQFGCLSNCYTLRGAPGFPNNSSNTSPNVNVNSHGEITYWSPNPVNPYVTYTSQATVTLPFSKTTDFFPPNGAGTSGDGGTNGFQAATMTGTLSAASTEKLTFSIQSDDMAFVFIDGQVVCDDGGVHGVSSVTCTTPTISAGDHAFALFFVDINTVQSGLYFNITTTDVTTTATPEPASVAVIGAGIMALGAVRRRRSAAAKRV